MLLANIREIQYSINNILRIQYVPGHMLYESSPCTYYYPHFRDRKIEAQRG